MTNIPNNEIWYTSSVGEIVEPNNTDAFGANIVSNTYENGQGKIVFDGDITSIGAHAFYENSNLTSITIPDSITVIEEEAFCGCNGLKSIVIPNNVTEIGSWAFTNCTGTCYINCNISSYNYLVDDTMVFEEDEWYTNSPFFNSIFTSIVIGDGVEEIGNLAFFNCPSLESVSIPDSITKIGWGAFGACCNLTAFYGKSVSKDNRCIILDGTLVAFALCGLTSYTIPEGITVIGVEAFAYCEDLRRINIPDSITKIEECAFKGCGELKEVHINSLEAWCKINFAGNNVNPLRQAHNLYLNNNLVTDLVIPDGVTSISDSAFESCGMTSVTIPDSVTKIGGSAFFWCDKLTNITIPDNVTEIGSSAFDDCHSLKKVAIPDGVTEIRDNTFAFCENLTSVAIPDSVTKIEERAFYCCENLKSITIPYSVTKIGSSAFADCNSLTSVNCTPTTPPTLGYDAFGGCECLENIYVPHASVDAYKSAESWRKYAASIVGCDL